MVGASKLDEKSVQQIKELFETTNLSDGEIGKMFGVSRTHIWKIRNGHRWNMDTRSFISKVEIDMILESERPFIMEEKKSKNIFQRVWQFILSVLHL